MGLDLTERAQAFLAQAAKEPSILLKIDGVEKIFGATIIRKYVYFGDGSEIGDPEINPLSYYIGGLNKYGFQKDILTLDGSSTSIKQSLDPFRGKGTSISTLSIALIDDGYASRLISPGEIVDDILQRQCKVFYGFNGTAYPDDYSVIFRGVVTDVIVDQGKIILQLNHSDDKKRTNIFKRVETKLTSAINDSTTTIPVESTTDFLSKILGPDGVTYDSTFRSFVRIDDEIIEYDNIVAGVLTGVVRGMFNSTPASHDDEATVSTYYRLKGNGIDLALKLMASGRVDTSPGGSTQPFVEDVPVTSINVGGTESQTNALFFKGVDLDTDYGLTAGDWVYDLFGAVDPANVVAKAQVLDIIRGETGDFLLLDGVTFSDEETEGMTCSFVSQYATLPDGCLFRPDEIDVAQHMETQRIFLSSVEYTFYIKEGIENASEFIEQQLYMPMAAYSLPRKARASIGYHIGPLPGADIVVFDHTNIKNAAKIQIKRSTNKNFWNEIVYKFDEDPVEDKYNTGYIAVSELSKAQIKDSPNRTLTIEAKGLRTTDQGQSIAAAQSLRRLKRYQYGAEVFVFESLLKAGFAVEIGDIILFDGSQFHLTDIKNKTKGLSPRLLEIQNKDFQLKTGDIRFEAVDTNFNGEARYGLISPSSEIVVGYSQTEFLIGPSFSQAQGISEWRKWQNVPDCSVRIRSADFSTVADSVIFSARTNRIILTEPLGFTPTAGMIMELTPYDDADVTMRTKLVYAHMKDSDFADGGIQYQML